MSIRRTTLMLHHDGELDAVDAERVERQLSWDADGRRYLDDLDTIGAAVRGSMEHPHADSALTDQIMARLEGPRQSSGARRKPDAPSWARVWQGRTLPFGLASTAALAAAAMFWLSVRVPTDKAIHPNTPRAIAALPAVADPAAEADTGVLIESVDFGGGGGSIFMVQGGRATTPVVWLTEPPETEGRSEPL